MSSDAVVEFPPFKRCSNARIFFSNASRFAFNSCLEDGGRRLLSLRRVSINRGGDLVKHCGDDDDETNAAGIFEAVDDGPVRRYLHVSA